MGGGGDPSITDLECNPILALRRCCALAQAAVSIGSAGCAPVEHQRHSVSTEPHQGCSRGMLWAYQGDIVGGNGGSDGQWSLRCILSLVPGLGGPDLDHGCAR